MASLDVRRPAAMEQLAVLGQQVGVETLPIVEGQQPTQIAQRALQAGRLGGYDVVLLDTAGRTTLDEAMMAEAAEVKRAANPHEVLLVADALTGQDAVNLARVVRRARRPHRHRAHPRRRRRPRRRRAVDARGHRQADQADGHRRAHGRAGGFPSRAHRRPHPRHGRHRLAGREGRRHDRRREGRARRREDAQGPVRPRRPARSAHADAADGRHGGADGHAARRRQDEEPARRRQSRRARAQAPDGGHRFDDAAGAPQPRRPQGQPQEAHRLRLRHQGRRRQPAAQDAPEHGRRDEGDGLGRQARADGRARQHAGPGRRHAEPRADGRSWRRRCRAVPPGMPGAPGLPPTMPGLPPKFRACRVPAAVRCCPALAASRRASADSRDWGRRNDDATQSCSVIPGAHGVLEWTHCEGFDCASRHRIDNEQIRRKEIQCP